MRLLKAFVAGFVAVLVFHQGSLRSSTWPD